MKIVLYKSIVINNKHKTVGSILDVTYDYANQLVKEGKAKFYNELPGKVRNKFKINLNEI